MEPQESFETISGQIKDHYPPVHTPLYEDLGRGYAIRFGTKQDGTGVPNAGTGTLTINLYFGSSNIPLTVWLQNFNFNLVKGVDEINVQKTPQSPTYEYGNKKKPDYKQLTNYLMSSWENISSFSQVYIDTNGNTQLDTLDYSLPNGTMGTTNFTKTQKPEEHTLQVIKELISNRVVLDDVIDFIQFNDIKQVTYNNKLLVRDSYTINALNNVVNVTWAIRKLNYN
jgi:hypothetical protein